MTRYILPVIVLGPVFLVGLALWATRLQLLSPDLRAAFLTFAMIFTTSSAVLWFAHLTNRTERRANAMHARLREAERARQASELAMVRAQKVAALGKLVGGVAHDFNNTLTVILGNLELIEESGDTASQEIYVQEAIAASNQAAQLTRQLLAYGRKSRLDPAPTVLDDLVEPTLSMFRRVCPAHVAISASLDAPGAVVSLDVANFQQALLNILINARDAQPGGGAIRISTRVGPPEADRMIDQSEGELLREGTYVIITVEDDGPGMAPRDLSRAAEPFFTTKPPGEGSGLGLAVVSGFCRQSGGGLFIESPGTGGLRVSMAFPELPVAEEAPAAADDRAQQARCGGRRVILVVDDEEAVTRVMSRQLQLDGHAVRNAVNAERALEVLEAGPTPDLVITDLVMPGRLQGHALAQEIARLYPAVKVLFMSGYESARAREGLEGLKGVPFLQKPIDRAALRAAVHAALEEDA